MKVTLGGNVLIDCPTLLAFRGHPVVWVTTNPFDLQLNIPDDLPGSRNQALPDKVRTEHSDSVVFLSPGKYAVAIAILLSSSTQEVYLRLDLRPLGINIFDDQAGLHVGSNVFVGNIVERSEVAINLG